MHISFEPRILTKGAYYMVENGRTREFWSGKTTYMINIKIHQSTHEPNLFRKDKATYDSTAGFSKDTISYVCTNTTYRSHNGL